MSAVDVYRARAAALRTEARYATGMVRRRMLDRAASCDRLAGSIERQTASERPATTLRLVGGVQQLAPIGGLS